MPNTQENYTDSQLEIISPGGLVSADFSNSQENGTDYIRLTLLDENGNYDRQFFSNVFTTDTNGNDVYEIQIYKNASGNIFVKPNEILDINGVPSGNYILQFDFLKDSTYSDNTLQSGYFIQEISPSRKEVRLLDNQTIITADSNGHYPDFDNLGDFDYNWVLGVSGGQNLSIVNYEIDDISNSDSPSWILRLNRPLPNNISTLTKCFVAKEVLATQVQNIVYISSVSQVGIGVELTVDKDFGYENTGIGSDAPENKDQLLISSSLSEDSLTSILSSINNKDINLNVDFIDYENHIHFGSAVKKLENFKDKVVEINGYSSEISSSLSATGSISTIINRRKLLFEKIRDVQTNFTPYEKFLYLDGQNQTTASAPGIGVNYARAYAMRKVVYTDSSDSGNNVESKKLDNYDGFNVVYNLDTENIPDTKVQLFDDTYLAEQSPFFNYSGSVYLSFVMKSDGAPTQFNTNRNYGSDDALSDGFTYDRVTIPEGTFSSDVIQVPGCSGSISTGSHYERYIFKASQSYWRPSWQEISSSDNNTYSSVENVTYGFDRAADLANVGNFTSDVSGSPTLTTNGGRYQILSGSSLNSDYLLDDIPIVLKDSSGQYGQLLSPSVFDSDGNLNSNIYRSGSFVLPSGDLFALRLTASVNYDGESENTSSFITDIKVTKNSPSGTLPFTPIYHTGSNEWKDWYSGSYDSASAYDEINIHSFENNLPNYILRSKDYGDL